MDKKFTLKTNLRDARPRSKRLREAGAGTGGSNNGSTVVNVSGEGVAQTEGHTHANKYQLDQITTDEEGYLSLTQQQEVVDPETGDTKYAGVTKKVNAGYADKAGSAHTLDDDSPILSRFLSKLADDVAAGHITFQKGIKVLTEAVFKNGAKYGEYVQGLAGAIIDAVGNIEAESITSRGYLKVFELIYNRLNALEGNTSFADVGTIETATYSGGVWLLNMRKRWEGDFTAFQPGDIIYGYVNELNNGDASEHYKAWAWIKSVDRANNTLTAAPYASAEVPTGVNHPLKSSMIITRWGNNIEANALTYSNANYKGVVIEKRGENEYVNIRQSTFYISSEDGNLVELMGVNAPILTRGNYGAVLGKLPAGLLDEATQKLINQDQPYLYARGIVVQDLIRIDYEGKITRSSNYRGNWSADTAASETDYYRSTEGVYDTVTHNGRLWQCVASRTTDEPTDTTGSWVNMTGVQEAPSLSVWKIIPNADVITIRYDADGTTTTEPSAITCQVLLTSTEEGAQTFTSSLELSTKGADLFYSLDGLNWQRFVMGKAEPLDLEDETDVLETEASGAFTVGGDDVSSTEIGDRIYFELRDAESNVLSRTIVPIIKDGKDGREGTDGLMVYPAGNYSPSAIYVSNDDSTPVVMYESNYYVLKRGKTYIGANMEDNRATPAGDVANGGADSYWRVFDKFNAIFADIIMAEFAKLGGAVFYGDCMISQNGTISGTDANGTDANGVAYYRKFTDGKTEGTFIPSLMLNMLTGEIVANKATIRGRIEAIGGTIAGFKIDEDEISYGDVTDLSSNDTSAKALISPHKLVIQDHDPELSDSYYRVALGKAADPNSDFDFGSVAFLYKRDRSNSYEKAFLPTLRIISNSNYGNLVGILSTGAVITNVGAISENGKIVVADGEYTTVEKLDSWEGTVFSIRNTISNDADIYLPTLNDIRRVLNNASGTLVWRIKLTVSISSYRVRLHKGIVDDNKLGLYNGTGAIDYFTAQPGKFYEAWLICDGYDNYWQVREI